MSRAEAGIDDKALRARHLARLWIHPGFAVGLLSYAVAATLVAWRPKTIVLPALLSLAPIAVALAIRFSHRAWAPHVGGSRDSLWPSSTRE